MRFSSSHFGGDLQGAFISALVALPMSIPLGALALSPLGPAYIPVGVVAGFMASIVAGGVSALAGGNPIQISGPRAAVSLLQAGVISTMLAKGMSPTEALALSFVALFLSGCVQMLFGAARFGSAARYVPYPVFAGFVNGVGLVIILGQLASSLGLPASLRWTDIPAHGAQISPFALVVTLVTMASVVLLPRLTKKVPSIVGALGIGVLLHHAMQFVLGGDRLGPLVILPPTSLPMPQAVSQALALDWTMAAPLLTGALPAILILALVSSMEAVMSSSAVEAQSGLHSNANRELIGQGLGNAIGACFGTVPSTGAPNRGLANYRAGGRTRMSGFLHSCFLLALLLWGESLLAHLPYSVLAGVMIMIGWSMTDAWSFKLARKHGRSFYVDCVTVSLVTGLTVFINLAVAVSVGLLIAALTFVINMSRPIVAQLRDRTQIRSRRIRPLAEEALLSHRGGDIVLVGLDGPLFFGTTEQFRSDLERARGEASVVILDMRRMREIDVSGVRMLRQIGEIFAKANCKILFAGLAENDDRRKFLLQTGVTATIPVERIIETVDGAIECAEQELLAAEAPSASLADFTMLQGLEAADMDALRAGLERRAFDAGQIIFRAGDSGDGFHLLTEGAVDIVLQNATGAGAVRLATFQPGTIFGEMALLSGDNRSATAVARQSVTTSFMSNEAFARLQVERPALAARLLMNIGKELAERLRLANTALQTQT